VDGFSLGAQEDFMRNFCQGNGYEVFDTYVDGGYSGKSDDRPEFKRMIADAQAGLFDVVIVHKFDRFARNRAQAVHYKALLKDIGINVVSVSEPIDPDSPSSILLEGVLETVAEWYSANLSEEVRKGKLKGFASGYYQGGYLKYGYKLKTVAVGNEDKHVLDIDEVEAAVLITIFNKAAGGMTLRKLAQWLYMEGIPSKQGGKWSGQHIARLLRDRTYLGEGTYGKTTRRGKRTVKSSNPVTTTVPQIVPEDLFNRVGAQLSLNKAKNTGSTKPDRNYILQHLGKCECGGALQCKTVKGRRYMSCSRQIYWPHIYKCYKPVHWHMDDIESHIWSEVEDTLHNYRDGTYDLLLDRFEGGRGDRDKQLADKKNELEQVMLGKQQILTQLRKGHIDDGEADLQLSASRSDQERLEYELLNLQSFQDSNDSAVDAFMAQLKQLDKWFDYGFYPAPAEKKEILNTLLQEFILHKDGRIELRFKVPVNEEQVAEKVLCLSHGELLRYT